MKRSHITTKIKFLFTSGLVMLVTLNIGATEQDDTHIVLRYHEDRDRAYAERWLIANTMDRNIEDRIGGLRRMNVLDQAILHTAIKQLGGKHIRTMIAQKKRGAPCLTLSLVLSCKTTNQVLVKNILGLIKYNEERSGGYLTNTVYYRNERRLFSTLPPTNFLTHHTWYIRSTDNFDSITIFTRFYDQAAVEQILAGYSHE
jgi:hypothetical protein